MQNLKSVFRLAVPMAAIMLLSIAFCPAADLQTKPAATQSATLPASEATVAAQTDAPAPKDSKQKSVLDEEVLDSPISFLKDAFSSSEEDTDVTTQPSTLVLAVKALFATLLSTII